MLNPVLWPSILKRPARKMVPATRNAISAITLISAAQNSISPNHLTEIMLTDSTITSAISATAHCGTTSNAFQKWKYVAIAVVSTMAVIAQLRKYIQPTT